LLSNISRAKITAYAKDVIRY